MELCTVLLAKWFRLVIVTDQRIAMKTKNHYHY